MTRAVCRLLLCTCHGERVDFSEERWVQIGLEDTTHIRIQMFELRTYIVKDPELSRYRV